MIDSYAGLCSVAENYTIVSFSTQGSEWDLHMKIFDQALKIFNIWM